MEYARAIGAVNFIARLLEQALAHTPAGALN
jgi:ABC-type methionine transport system permease subunit